LSYIGIGIHYYVNKYVCIRLTDCKGGGTDQEIGGMRVYRGCGDRVVVVFYTHDHCIVRPIGAAAMVPVMVVVVTNATVPILSTIRWS